MVDRGETIMILHQLLCNNYSERITTYLRIQMWCAFALYQHTVESRFKPYSLLTEFNHVYVQSFN